MTEELVQLDMNKKEFLAMLRLDFKTGARPLSNYVPEKMYQKADFSKMSPVEQINFPKKEQAHLSLYDRGVIVPLGSVLENPLTVFKELFPKYSVSRMLDQDVDSSLRFESDRKIFEDGFNIDELSIPRDNWRKGIMICSFPLSSSENVSLDFLLKKHHCALNEFERDVPLTEELLIHYIKRNHQTYSNLLELVDQKEYSRALIRNALWDIKDNL